MKSLIAIAKSSFVASSAVVGINRIVQTRDSQMADVASASKSAINLLGANLLVCLTLSMLLHSAIARSYKLGDKMDCK